MTLPVLYFALWKNLFSIRDSTQSKSLEAKVQNISPLVANIHAHREKSNEIETSNAFEVANRDHPKCEHFLLRYGNRYFLCIGRNYYVLYVPVFVNWNIVSINSDHHYDGNFNRWDGCKCSLVLQTRCLLSFYIYVVRWPRYVYNRFMSILVHSLVNHITHVTNNIQNRWIIRNYILQMTLELWLEILTQTNIYGIVIIQRFGVLSEKRVLF